MGAEQRIVELGIVVPEFGGAGYYGEHYGRMRPFRFTGNVLHLSGHVPSRDGAPLHPGRLGAEVTVEQGYEAARQTGINVLAGLRQALGDLDRVSALVKSLNFVACEPRFGEVHRVSSGMSDLMADVFGEEIGVGCRATIGVQALADHHCFETWATFEVRL